MKCPCHSGKAYATCCESFHLHENAPDALHLMRSRYSAYALGKTDYILHTTHPDHPDQKIPIEQKRRDIEAFSKGTQFIDLKIMEFKEEGGRATVTFYAQLEQKGVDASFQEKSLFALDQGKWKYLSGAPA